MQINLYSGPDCCLCDQAKEVLNTVVSRLQLSIEVTTINIRSDTQLYHLYGARIPVLKRVDNEVELGWPFGEEEVERFLQ